jgi:hypothetical protein
MNCIAKQLNDIGPNGWTVRVMYGDGSLPTTFTIEELKDIEKQIDLRSDWVSISVNRHVPKPPSEPGPPGSGDASKPGNELVGRRQRR